MADYKISDDGTIVYEERIGATSEKSTEEKMYAEYNRLVYEVIGHPDRFTPAEIEVKKQRMKEIEKSRIALNNNKALNMKLAQLKVQAKSQATDNTLTSAIANFRKQND